ncbi:hypothetical protein FACS1894167_11830 [Synergistales bacterium]|nr:hypothetical protein FACS1894167_11830 [Synergistales bacterium]
MRGYDLAHMTFVETQNGFIAVDVTSYRESAKAAVDLFYENIPQEKREKKIHTIIYTHSHVDHYGGVLGVLEDSKVRTGASVEIVAPDGFMDAAVSENVTKIFDGMAVDFLLALHTEAPAEMTMLFSDYRSLCLAEICNQTQHNILTPRGAEVCDTIAWSSAPDAWGSDKYNQATALQADGGPRRPPITSQPPYRSDCSPALPYLLHGLKTI